MRFFSSLLPPAMSSLKFTEKGKEEREGEGGGGGGKR
jgi:hypothetical protein